MAFSLLTNPFQDDTCSFSGCHPEAVNRTATSWDIVNPILFFADEGALCQYANVTACCDLDKNSFFHFLRPFCIDLLPFSIFYCLIRIVVSIVNYLFIYRKKILGRLNRQQNSLVDGDGTLKSQYHYINYFKTFLRTSFILDICSSLFSFWIFKGYQYYASQFSSNPANPSIIQGNFALLGDYTGTSAENKREVIILFIAVFIWFCLECWKTYIQIFSVSSLTHLDKLKKDTQNHKEQHFYKTHKKFALWWTIAFFSVGIIFLVPNFFWKMVFGTENFQDYKLYYKYYSINTISFWLSYTLIIILILTDRILAYDGFKKRQEFKASERKKTQPSVRDSTHRIVNLNNYNIATDSVVYDQVKQTLSRKFPDKTPIELEELTQQVTDIYNVKMRDHFFSLKRKVYDGIDDTLTIETSMDYVRYLRGFNVLNLIGYALILFSYREEVGSTTSLSVYMIGFTISAVSTFGFELTHNYLLYRSYFLQILAKMNRRDD